MFVFAVYGSLLPFRYVYRPFDEVLAAFSQIKLYDPSNLEARGDWVISTVLFAALSFLLIAALSVDRPRWVGFLAALVGMCACLVLSVALEFTQIYFPPRTVSLNDIFMESL